MVAAVGRLGLPAPAEPTARPRLIRSTPSTRRTGRISVSAMVLGLIELVVVLAVLGLFVSVGWALWGALQRGDTGPLPSRRRAELAAAIAQARWMPGHDEIDGTTRVLVRRVYTGLDGRPTVLEERVLETFPARDPAWEARFTEAMSAARFRCAYLNAEEAQ
jgi:hypothetical protein